MAKKAAKKRKKSKKKPTIKRGDKAARQLTD